MRELELSRRIRQFLRLGSGDVQTLVGGQAYNPAAVAITGGSITGVTGVPTILAAGANVTSANSTSEQVLKSVSVPAGLGAAQGVRIRAAWVVTNGASNKTLKVYVNGTAGTALISHSVTANDAVIQSIEIWNQAATNSQIATGTTAAYTSTGGTSTLGYKVSASIDTTAAWTIDFAVTKATGTDIGTLSAYSLEYIKQ